MYWKEIPVQIQAQDAGAPPVGVPLDARFQQGVDAIAMFDGSMGSDDYLMAWEWHEYGDVEGAAQDQQRRLWRRGSTRGFRRTSWRGYGICRTRVSGMRGRGRSITGLMRTDNLETLGSDIWKVRVE